MMALSSQARDEYQGCTERTIQLDLPKMKQELVTKGIECQIRGLVQSFKWLSELSHALRNVKMASIDLGTFDLLHALGDEFEVYQMSKSYFDLKEYDRCAHFTKNCKTNLVRFLHFYSRYLSGEKKWLDYSVDLVMSVEKKPLEHLVSLRVEMEKLYEKDQLLDGYCLYLYGVVLKKLSLPRLAMKILLEAIHKEPCHWGAWLEFSELITDRSEIQALKLPDHWMKEFFLAHNYLDLLNDQALDIYFALQKAGLSESTYISAQVAISFHNKREVDQALQYFAQISEVDPFRLDNLDTYSNLLYVKEQRVELAFLAHRVVDIDKYRSETCCVIGNYYSLRSEHEKAVTYFQRALRLNPNNFAVWTLMGHEFIELKNTNAAIQSYRRALEANKRDYRAWYGLGQTYEMLKMPFYCIYYYKKAQELRPSDSRMLMALGHTYDKLDKHKEALKCFWKAHCVGDIECGSALFHMAKLYERSGENDQAAAAYHQYISDKEDQGIMDRDQQSRAYRFLANYYLKKGKLDDAYEYGQRCTEFADTLEEGKAILTEIANKRSLTSGPIQINIPAHDTQNDATDDNDSTTNPGQNLEPMNLTFS